MSRFKVKSELNINKPTVPAVVENKKEEVNSDVWNFTKITIQQLGKELEETINRGTPFFLWGRKRLNNKIRLDNEKQLLIFDKIANLRLISSEFSRLHADAIFSQEYIENLVTEKRLEAEHFYETRVAEQRKKLTAIKTDIILNENLITHDVLSQEDKRADIRRKNALAGQEEEKQNESKKRNEIIDKLLAEADFNNLTIQQTYILTAFLNANVNQFSEFELKEKSKDFIIQATKAEADKKTHEANITKADVDMKNFNNTQAKKDAGL